MQTLDEKPETIHLYVVRERKPTPSILPIVLSVTALLVIVVIAAFLPYQQPEERMTIRTPAVFLPLKSFDTSVAIIPTGIKTIPAAASHGTLTLTNGSVIESTLPRGVIFSSRNGVEVVTDEAVFVPAGSAAGYGYAIVTAHAVLSGKSGNIPAFNIDLVEGSSIYIRNLTAFIGGRDSYFVKVETERDKQIATDSARAILATRLSKIREFLAYPCKESAIEKKPMLQLSWTCQFVTYSLPSYMKVVSVRLAGHDVLVNVRFVARPIRIWVK
jgi:hypothetical protein